MDFLDALDGNLTRRELTSALMQLESRVQVLEQGAMFDAQSAPPWYRLIDGQYFIDAHIDCPCGGDIWLSNDDEESKGQRCACGRVYRMTQKVEVVELADER